MRTDVLASSGCVQVRMAADAADGQRPHLREPARRGGSEGGRGGDRAGGRGGSRAATCPRRFTQSAAVRRHDCQRVRPPVYWLCPRATNTAAAASRTVVPMLAGRRMPATVDTPAVKHARGRGLRTPCRVCGVCRLRAASREERRSAVVVENGVCVSLSPAVNRHTVCAETTLMSQAQNGCRKSTMASVRALDALECAARRVTTRPSRCAVSTCTEI